MNITIYTEEQLVIPEESFSEQELVNVSPSSFSF